MSEKEEKKDPFDGEYIGNIWGWRLSLISAAMILGLLGVVAYRHYALDVPLGFDDPMEQINPADTTEVEDTLQ